MSIDALSWAFKVQGVSPTAKLVLILLCDAHNGHTGECYPTLKRLIKATGLSESSVKRNVRELEEAGHIRRETKTAEDGRTIGVRYHLGLSGDVRGGGHIDPLGGLERTGGGSLLDPANNTGKIPESRTDTVPPDGATVCQEITTINQNSTGAPPSTRSPRRSASPPVYHPDFLHLWERFPRHPNASKAEAFKLWTRLTEQERSDCFRGTIQYVAFRNGEERCRFHERGTTWSRHVAISPQ